MVQRIGVQIVIEGSGNFNAAVQSFVNGITKMNSATSSIAGKTVSSVSTATNSLGLLERGWQRVGDIITGVSVVEVFRSIIDWIGSMKSEVLDAVGIFQLLEIRLERMAAIKMSDVLDISVLDVYAQHMDDISASAEDLMMWIRKLAVTTPFSAESVAQAVALAQAFGFTESEAKVLTMAVGDFTAGMGLTNDQLHRILYNFGQMQSTGKVMGRQLYNLGQNLVPVKTIIQEMADQAGISFNEMKTAMQKGIVSADQFIAKFIELSNTKFAGAMEKSVETLPAVMQNIHDFIQTLIGLEVFGPIFKSLAVVMNDFLQAAFNPAVIRFFDALGKTLDMAFKIIYGAIQAVTPTIKTFFSVLGIGAPTALGVASAILKLAIGIKFFIQMIRVAIGWITHFLALIQNKLGITFSGIASNMFSWGANIILAFAKGMASALKFVIQVLSSLARLITGLLKGGSPPKLLPDLSWWGNQAMQAYLDGWGSADFSVFDDIADTIASYLRALGESNIKEENLIPRIIGTRTAIAAAMDIVKELGYVTEEALNNIMKAAGVTSESIKDYIRDLINLQAVTLNVGAAQDILSFNIDTVGEISTIFGKTITDLAGLAAAAMKLTGDLGVAVRDYVAKLYALKDANDAAAEAEKNLDKVTKYYDDTLKDLNDQLKDVTEVYDENVRLAEIQAALDTGLLTAKEKERLENEKKALMLKKTIRLTEEERDKAVGNAQDIADEKQKALKEAEDAAEIQKRLAEELAKIQLEAAKEQYDAAKALVDLQTENNQLMSDQIALLKRLAEELKGLGGAGGEPLDLGFDWPDPGDEIEGLGDTMQKALDALQADLQKQFDDFIASLTSPFEGVIGLLQGLFIDIGNVFSSFINSPGMQEVIKAVQGFGLEMQLAWLALQVFWKQQGPAITQALTDLVNGIIKALFPLAGTTESGVAGGISWLGDTISRFAVLLVEKGPEITKAVQDFVDWIIDTGIPKLKEGWKWFVDEAIPWIEDFAKTVLKIAAIVVPIILFIIGVFEMLQGALAIAGVITAIEAFIASIGAALTTIATLVAGVITIIGAITAPFWIIGGIIIALIAMWVTNLGGFRDWITKAFAALWETISPLLDTLRKAFADMQPAILQLKTALEPVFAFIGQLFMFLLKVVGWLVGVAFAIILGVIAGIITGVTRFITSFIQIFTTVIGYVVMVIDAIKNIFSGLFMFVEGLLTGNWQEMWDGFIAFLAGIGELIWGLLGTILGFFISIFYAISGFIAGFIQGVIDFFKNLWDRLVGHSIIIDMLTGIWTAFVTWLTDILNYVGQWIADVIQSILDKIGEFIQAGVDIITGLLSGIQSIFLGAVGIIAKVGQWIADTIAKIVESLPTWIQTGVDIIKKFLQGLTDTFFAPGTGVIDKMKQYIQDVIDAIVKKIDDWKTLGKDIITGILDGLKANAVQLTTYLTGVIKALITSILTLLHITSPSKVFRDIGENMMQGMINGIADNTQSLTDTLSAAVMDATTGAEFAVNTSGILDMVNQNTARTVTPSYGNSVSNNSTRNINIQVNPNYSNIQSEAGIYYDITAALHAVNL